MLKIKGIKKIARHLILLFFFVCAKKNQKSTPENENSTFSGLFPD
jgi:hypothetical protein